MKVSACSNLMEVQLNHLRGIWLYLSSYAGVFIEYFVSCYRLVLMPSAKTPLQIKLSLTVLSLVHRVILDNNCLAKSPVNSTHSVK